jgi:sodium transport system permease protein
MLNAILAVAHKEMVDGMRDVRSLVSALLYALMGPVVVGLVSRAIPASAKNGDAVLIGMMSIFTLVAAFVGGMNVAMDLVAGERERRSLLPLLLNPVGRPAVALGKWLAVGFFALCGLSVNLAGSALVWWNAGMHIPAPTPLSILAVPLALAPVALLAAAVQLLTSSVCRSTKEAQTYLSMIVFLPMAIGTFLVFSPPAAHSWIRLLPLAGSQLLLEGFLGTGRAGLLAALELGCASLGLTIPALWMVANLLERDEIVYGN